MIVLYRQNKNKLTRLTYIKWLSIINLSNIKVHLKNNGHTKFGSSKFCHQQTAKTKYHQALFHIYDDNINDKTGINRTNEQTGISNNTIHLEWYRRIYFRQPTKKIICTSRNENINTKTKCRIQALKDHFCTICLDPKLDQDHVNDPLRQASPN